MVWDVAPVGETNHGFAAVTLKTPEAGTVALSVLRRL